MDNLERIKNVSSFTELLEVTKLKMSVISSRYEIPYRTVQCWKTGTGKIAPWALKLLAKDIAEVIDPDREAKERLIQLYEECEDKESFMKLVENISSEEDYE